MLRVSSSREVSGCSVGSIRIAIVSWLVGAGIKWVQRQGHSLGPLDRYLREPQSGSPRGSRAKRAPRTAGSAKAELTRAAAREAASTRAATATREPAGPATAAAPTRRATAAPAEAAPEPTADDLKVIEGIGPRFEELLHGAGVDSFTALAAMTPEQIESAIRDAGGRVVSAGTWPQQAGLAASGEWDALAEMQSHLKGGREVSTSD